MADTTLIALGAAGDEAWRALDSFLATLSPLEQQSVRIVVKKLEDAGQLRAQPITYRPHPGPVPFTSPAGRRALADIVEFARAVMAGAEKSFREHPFGDGYLHVQPRRIEDPVAEIAAYAAQRAHPVAVSGVVEKAVAAERERITQMVLAAAR